MEKKLLNRSEPSLPLLSEIMDAWGFSLTKRIPGQAMLDENGELITTMDMITFLVEIARLGLVINLPTYKAQGPATKVEGEIVVSKENRHGKVVGLVSHKDRFNFSVRIVDMNVMTAQEVGSYRTFTVFSDGVWWDGFREIQFQPMGKEKEFLDRLTNGTMRVSFTNFISPNRWPSIYGKWYRLAKVGVDRIADELKWLKPIAAQAKEEKVWPKKEKVGETKTKEVWKFNGSVSHLGLVGEYSDTSPQEALEREKQLKKMREVLLFNIRASEWAFFNMLVSKVGEDALLEWSKTEHTDDGLVPKASWAKHMVWQVGHQDGARRKNKKCYLVLLDDTGKEVLRFHVNRMKVQVAK